MDKADRLNVLEQILEGMNDRRKEAGELLALRTPKRAIAKILCDHYQITSKQAHEDIKYAINAWKEEAKVYGDDDSYQLALSVREEWINRCIQAGNIKLAWEIQKDFDTIIGLYKQGQEPSYQIVMHKFLPCGSDDAPVTPEEMEAYKKAVELDGKDVEEPDSEGGEDC